MSMIILSQSESATTTNNMVFPAQGNEPAASCMQVVRVVMPEPVHPVIKRSPRNGKMPAHVAQYERELNNADYRNEMQQARERLAQDMAELGIDSLATLRLNRGLSQSQLAQMIGTSQPHIAKIEAGSGIPNWATVVKIADVLNVSLDGLRPFIRVAAQVENGMSRMAPV
jgi:DNA-binding XRE family transcriptional regulator